MTIGRGKNKRKEDAMTSMGGALGEIATEASLEQNTFPPPPAAALALGANRQRIRRSAGWC
jgi:hypothetical protein